MLGDFLIRILILILGYAYPGFECYKAVEKNKADVVELRFWCQYWIIAALVTVLERFTDIIVGWLPLYGEMKVAFFVYLWYPKIKGTGFVYQTLLRPLVSRHENDIDRQLMELKARARYLFTHYWQISAKMGHSAFFQGLEYLATQSVRLKANATSQGESSTQEMNNGSKKSSSREENKVKKASISSPPASPSVKKVDNEEGYANNNDALNQVRSRLRRLNTGSGSPRSPHTREL